MLHLLKHLKDSQRYNYIKTGLFVALIASCFLYDRHYFFFPPALAPYWNSPVADTIGLIAGIGLLLYGVFNCSDDWWITLLLSVCAGFMAFLVSAELFHIFGRGYFIFHPLILFEVYFIVNIMQIAYERHPSKSR